MLRVNQVKIRPGQGEREIRRGVAGILKVNVADIASIELVRCSIDARKKPEIWYSYTVDVTLKKRALEDRSCKRLGPAQVSRTARQEYRFPQGNPELLSHPPVIVGMGPAGLFCGYYLARQGYKPILLERGRDVDRRREDVQRFWDGGELEPQSNVQFGEGGAGTFSDGKLNTLVKDKYGRNREVLRTLVAHGAPERILYDAKPHIGTDVLAGIVKGLRQDILAHGGQVFFDTALEGLELKNGKRIAAALISGGRRIPCEKLVLATGHSARDTFHMLYEAGLPMEAKPFAVGLRIEHPQSMIDLAQYGTETPGLLGAAPYKVTAQTSSGRGVYSFCMCPGGYVVNASSESGRLAVNGMSYSGRGGVNANSAIVVSVTPEDYGSDHPLAGIEFQRQLEERAYALGGGAVPVQRYGQYRASVEQRRSHLECQNITESAKHGADVWADSTLTPCIKGKWREADLGGLLPEDCSLAFLEGMEQFGRQIPGFDRPDAILSGVESRTSSPVRILRNNDTLQSQIGGIYPCGEGAGYAGGITSAAMDGIKVAEAIATSESFLPLPRQTHE
ncbi:MAG: FAD-dependent oxidoreductase [bacterium]|nr:FAD-dependent oxidoreductase [bacterium]MCM1376655.1 FAD-binding protein [Muribaculum sp.]